MKIYKLSYVGLYCNKTLTEFEDFTVLLATMSLQFYADPNCAVFEVAKLGNGNNSASLKDSAGKIIVKYQTEK